MHPDSNEYGRIEPPNVDTSKDPEMKAFAEERSNGRAGIGRIEFTPNPDRTVYEVNAPPPVPHVGQNFRYVGNMEDAEDLIASETVEFKPSNKLLPVGEAGDEFNDLRVALGKALDMIYKLELRI